MCILEPGKGSSEKRANLTDVEVSLRAAIATPRGGRIVTMGFPGLAYGVDGKGFIDPDRLNATLDHGNLEGASLLIVLVEPGELPPDAMDLLTAAGRARGIRIVHLPIKDYNVPDAAFAAGWARVADAVRDGTGDGGVLGLSCHYGAGRSGMIAAGLLIDQGLSAGEAVAALRRQFPDSVESEAQMRWLMAKEAAGQAAEK